MKDIKKIIGKTIKDVIYEGNRDISDLTIKFDDGTEIIISTEYNAPNMWSEIIQDNNINKMIEKIDKDFMEHLTNLNTDNKDKTYYCTGSCGTLALDTPIICPQCNRYEICTNDKETCQHIENLSREEALEICLMCDDCIDEYLIKKYQKHE